MKSGFKMKGFGGFKPSPAKQTKFPNSPGAQRRKAPRITSEDEESAYENAQNDYDTDNPTKKQLADALQEIQNERSNKERSNAERALEAEEDAKGVGGGSNRKVMNDGPVNKTQAKKIADNKAKHNALTDVEKKKLQDEANAKRKAFEATPEYKKRVADNKKKK